MIIRTTKYYACIHLHAEFKQQILANLGNFAYDPINYEYFRQLNILDLFLDVLAEETDDKMVEFAMGGVCNCCLDRLNKEYLVQNDGVELTIKILSSSNEETVLNSIATLMYLTTPDTKKGMCNMCIGWVRSFKSRLHIPTGIY